MDVCGRLDAAGGNGRELDDRKCAADDAGVAAEQDKPVLGRAAVLRRSSVVSNGRWMPPASSRRSDYCWSGRWEWDRPAGDGDQRTGDGHIRRAGHTSTGAAGDVAGAKNGSVAARS